LNHPGIGEKQDSYEKIKERIPSQNSKSKYRYEDGQLK